LLNGGLDGVQSPKGSVNSNAGMVHVEKKDVCGCIDTCIDN